MEIGWVIGGIVTLVVKFFIYAAYASKLNTWFEQSHNTFKISGIRLAISMVFTAINAKLFMVLINDDIKFIVSPAFAVILAIVAWYIIIKKFYVSDKTDSALIIKSVLIGTLISAVIAGITTFLTFLGFLSTVNFC